MEFILLGAMAVVAIVGIIFVLSFIDSKLDDSNEVWDDEFPEDKNLGPLLGVVKPNNKNDKDKENTNE
jgi:hypothetical protein